MMSVCQEACLALVPDWPCPSCPTVVMVAWEETGDDETTAGGSTLVPGR